MWKKILVPVLNICAFYKQELQTVWSCPLIFCVQSRIKQQKYLKTLTYQRLSRHNPFSTFNFMCKICVYIKYLPLCINIIKTNFTVMYLFGCQYINKLARKNVAICVVATYVLHMNIDIPCVFMNCRVQGIVFTYPKFDKRM